MTDTNAVLSTLHSKLKATITPMKLTPAELEAVQPAIETLSDASALGRHSQDVRIYVEVCVAHKELTGNVVMLVMDDHQLFQRFAMSLIAENLLASQVQTMVKAARPCSGSVMDISPPIRIRVVGKVIPGM